jgi:hypothetical protein
MCLEFAVRNRADSLPGPRAAPNTGLGNYSSIEVNLGNFEHDRRQSNLILDFGF